MAPTICIDDDDNARKLRHRTICDNKNKNNNINSNSTGDDNDLSSLSVINYGKLITYLFNVHMKTKRFII